MKRALLPKGMINPPAGVAGSEQSRSIGIC